MHSATEHPAPTERAMAIWSTQTEVVQSCAQQQGSWLRVRACFEELNHGQVSFQAPNKPLHLPAVGSSQRAPPSSFPFVVVCTRGRK